LQAVVDPAAFAEREVMPPDLRRDGLNDIHDILLIKSESQIRSALFQQKFLKLSIAFNLFDGCTTSSTILIGILQNIESLLIAPSSPLDADYIKTACTTTTFQSCKLVQLICRIQRQQVSCISEYFKKTCNSRGNQLSVI